MRTNVRIVVYWMSSFDPLRLRTWDPLKNISPHFEGLIIHARQLGCQVREHIPA